MKFLMLVLVASSSIFVTPAQASPEGAVAGCAVGAAIGFAHSRVAMITSCVAMGALMVTLDFKNNSANASEAAQARSGDAMEIEDHSNSALPQEEIETE